MYMYNVCGGRLWWTIPWQLSKQVHLCSKSICLIIISLNTWKKRLTQLLSLAKSRRTDSHSLRSPNFFPTSLGACSQANFSLILCSPEAHLFARSFARSLVPSLHLENWKVTHPGVHVSVSGRHFIPHVIPVVLAGLPWHVTAPGVGAWATAHRVPIIIHSICSKHDDTLTTSSGSSLKQFKG